MRIYIAGPMTGVENNNREAFSRAWHALIDAGFDAVSPHFLESAIEVETRAKMGTAHVYRHVLPVDVFAISSVDAVLALPGWEDSKGCQFERHYAGLIEAPWVAPVCNGDFLEIDPLSDDVYSEVLKHCIREGITALKELALARTLHP